MKYCSKCGAQLNDEDLYCPKCGAKCFQEEVHQEVVDSNRSTSSSSGSTMKMVAFVFCLIGTITLGFALIPLIWCIPMTVKVYNAWKYNEKVSVAFSVCTVLFVSLIGGLLLLISDEVRD